MQVKHASIVIQRRIFELNVDRARNVFDRPLRIAEAMKNLSTFFDCFDIPVIDVKNAGGPKETSIQLTHTFDDGSKATFLIIDNPVAKLSHSHEWANVVGVIAAGNAWQFKGWKYAKPVDIFNRVLGVHLKYDDAETVPEVKKWNVTVLTVNKFKRHLDPTTVVQFWRLLDDFLEKRKKAIAGMKARKK